MDEKGKAAPALEDKAFVSTLVFLSDITDHLHVPNLNLQSPNKLITGMHDNVKCFKMKLLLWKKTDLNRELNKLSVLAVIRRGTTQLLARF